ncbi:MAG: hypothetical protein LBV08_04465 [Clostridiales bacterium]|jgi:hypothetical protein|nr:hypothetical protein [Clostridiales bacterium]
MIDFIAKYWLQFAMGLMAGGFTTFCRYIWQQQRAIKDGVKALLKDRIIGICNHYREKGNCPVYALEMIDALYNEYANLGGNGTAETLRNEMRTLPREAND